MSTTPPQNQKPKPKRRYFRADLRPILNLYSHQIWVKFFTKTWCHVKHSNPCSSKLTNLSPKPFCPFLMNVKSLQSFPLFKTSSNLSKNVTIINLTRDFGSSLIWWKIWFYLDLSQILVKRYCYPILTLFHQIFSHHSQHILKKPFKFQPSFMREHSL